MFDLAVGYTGNWSMYRFENGYRLGQKSSRSILEQLGKGRGGQAFTDADIEMTYRRKQGLGRSRRDYHYYHRIFG